MFNWKKKGLIYKPDINSKYPTHAVLPHISKIKNSYHIYFGSRDKNNVGHSFSSIFDPNNPNKINRGKNPILYPGDIGFFDQHGAICSSTIEVEDSIYMYYIGWVKGYENPFFQANIGLAISSDSGKTFKKYSSSPIIPKSDKDPILTTSPYVFKHDQKYIMVYISGLKWERIQGKLQSFYRICSAESANGINWENTGNVLIDCDEKISNFARPWVIYFKGIFHLFYSYASPGVPYQIGCSTSKDFKKWDRNHNITSLSSLKSKEESNMMCYPSLFQYQSTLFLFYNGNNFGKEGILMATCDLT